MITKQCAVPCWSTCNTVRPQRCVVYGVREVPSSTPQRRSWNGPALLDVGQESAAAERLFDCVSCDVAVLVKHRIDSRPELLLLGCDLVNALELGRAIDRTSSCRTDDELKPPGLQVGRQGASSRRR
jgi:hypothetical protein